MSGVCGGQLAGRQTEAECAIARGHDPGRFARTLNVCPMLFYVVVRDLDRINSEADVPDAEARRNRRPGRPSQTTARILEEVEALRVEAGRLRDAGASRGAIAARIGKNVRTVDRYLNQLDARSGSDLARTG